MSETGTAGGAPAHAAHEHQPTSGSPAHRLPGGDDRVESLLFGEPSQIDGEWRVRQAETAPSLPCGRAA